MLKDLFGKDFQDKVKKAAETVKDTAKATADVVSENAQKTADSVKGKVQDAVDKGQIPDIRKVDIKKPDIKVPDQIQAAFSKNKKQPVPGALEIMRAGSISVQASLKIFYYLIAADGVIQEEEKERLDAIGTDLDAKFPEYKDSLFTECEKELNPEVAPGDDYDVIEEATDRAILAEIHEDDLFIPIKVFVWDMLSVACSDGSFDEKERKLIRYIVRKYKIDYAQYLEMESSMTAVLDIEKERIWIKTTNRPYLQIEEEVNELNEREQTIYESVQALAML